MYSLHPRKSRVNIIGSPQSRNSMPALTDAMYNLFDVF